MVNDGVFFAVVRLVPSHTGLSFCVVSSAVVRTRTLTVTRVRLPRLSCAVRRMLLPEKLPAAGTGTVAV